MRRSSTIAVLVLAGCTTDPIVGSWSADNTVLTFHRDGSITGYNRRVPESMSCPSPIAAEAAACSARHGWRRFGADYEITIMAYVRRRSDGVVNGMFNLPGPRCECSPLVTSRAQLHGDELVVDAKERGHRVRVAVKP